MGASTGLVGGFGELELSAGFVAALGTGGEAEVLDESAGLATTLGVFAWGADKTSDVAPGAVSGVAGTPVFTGPFVGLGPQFMSVMAAAEATIERRRSGRFIGFLRESSIDERERTE